MRAEDLIGHRLAGGFRIHDFVASGGFAWVYEAYTPEGMRCAVKVPFHESGDALKRFVREIVVLRELPRDPNCVGYVGDGKLDDGRPFVAMEFVDGATLAEVLRQRPIWDPADACALGTQLCSALRGLHRLGLANRDVSPNNIMLTNDRVLKLMDFGLVKDAQGLLNLLESEDILAGRDFAENLDGGLLVGTLDYVAPEQLSDSSITEASAAQTDTWSDVYSVALILWQMITGEKLFQLDMSGSDQQKVARRVLRYVQARTSFDEDLLPRHERIPEPLWQVLIRALRLDPRRRQRNAIELGHDIQTFLSTGEAVQHDDTRTENVSLQDFLDFLSEHDPEEEPTSVFRRSSIPVVLNFDDETASVPNIPVHDATPRFPEYDDDEPSD